MEPAFVGFVLGDVETLTNGPGVSRVGNAALGRCSWTGWITPGAPNTPGRPVGQLHAHQIGHCVYKEQRIWCAAAFSVDRERRGNARLWRVN